MQLSFSNMTKCKFISALKIEMLGSMPFFKRPERKIRPAVTMPGSRPFIGHPRFGFHTMLNQDSFGQLPTNPSIVGGNVNWTKSRVTPATLQLHSALSDVRNMNYVPADGSVLRLGEPNGNSIHTSY
jgi:hypothetical protein